jgi:hypothetical protein
MRVCQFRHFGLLLRRDGRRARLFRKELPCYSIDFRVAVKSDSNSRRVRGSPAAGRAAVRESGSTRTEALQLPAGRVPISVWEDGKAPALNNA